MTTNGKFSVLAVILVTLMVSCAFVPAVNALSNSEDENTAIMTSEETETQNENVDLLSQLAAMFGLDKDSGLQGILDAIGLSELLDQETIDKILESGLNPSELLKILNEKIPEIPTDLSKILSILSDPGDLNGTYHFDVLDLGFVHFTDLTVTIEVSEAGTLQVFEIEAGSAMVAALGISAGVEDL